MDDIVRMRKDRIIRENALKGTNQYKDFIEINKTNGTQTSTIMDAKKQIWLE